MHVERRSAAPREGRDGCKRDRRGPKRSTSCRKRPRAAARRPTAWFSRRRCSWFSAVLFETAPIVRRMRKMTVFSTRSGTKRRRESPLTWPARGMGRPALFLLLGRRRRLAAIPRRRPARRLMAVCPCPESPVLVLPGRSAPHFAANGIAFFRRTPRGHMPVSPVTTA